MKKNKRIFTPDKAQRIIAILIIITALVQMIDTISNSQWKLTVTQILQIHHPYVSTLPTLVSAIIAVIWWVILFLLGVYLLIDKDFWSQFNM